MANGYHKSDPPLTTVIPKKVLIQLLEKRIKDIQAIEHNAVVQEAQELTNDMEIRINLMVQHHIYGTIQELKSFIKTIEEL